MASLSTELTEKTVDNLVSESLCIPCNPLRRAGVEAGFTGWIGQMRQSRAEEERATRIARNPDLLTPG